MRQVVGMNHIDRRKISLVKDVIRRRLKGKAIEFVNNGIPSLCKNFKDGVLKLCDEVCG